MEKIWNGIKDFFKAVWAFVTNQDNLLYVCIAGGALLLIIIVCIITGCVSKKKKRLKKEAEEKARLERLENPTTEDLLKDIRALLRKQTRQNRKPKKAQKPAQN